MVKHLSALFSVLIICLASCNSQNLSNEKLNEIAFTGKKVKISIYDSLNKRPIVGGSVVYKSFNIGTLTDTLGLAILPYKKDSIIISSIGYSKVSVILDSDSSISLFLSPVTYNLPEVLLKSYKLTNEVLETGVRITNRNNFYKGGYGNQIAFQVSSNSDLSRAIISNINIPILKTTYSSRIKLELRYCDHIRFTNYELIFDSLILVNPRVSNISINIENYKIDLFERNLWCVITNLGTNDFIGDRYLNYKGQVVEPFYLITEQDIDKTTYLNYLNKDWIQYPLIPNNKGIKSKTNIGYSIKLRLYK